MKVFPFTCMGAKKVQGCFHSLLYVQHLLHSWAHRKQYLNKSYIYWMNRPQFIEQKMEVQKKNGLAQGQRVLRDMAATTLGFPPQWLEVSVLAITCNNRNGWQKGESWLGLSHWLFQVLRCISDLLQLGGSALPCNLWSLVFKWPLVSVSTRVLTSLPQSYVQKEL